MPEPVSAVPVPDEAILVVLKTLETPPGTVAKSVIGEALEAAAPFIARAAQVQVLREMAEKVDHMHDHAAGEISAAAFGEVWLLLTERADELEGQQ